MELPVWRLQQRRVLAQCLQSPQHPAPAPKLRLGPRHAGRTRVRYIGVDFRTFWRHVIKRGGWWVAGRP